MIYTFSLRRPSSFYSAQKLKYVILCLCSFGWVGWFTLNISEYRLSSLQFFTRLKWKIISATFEIEILTKHTPLISHLKRAINTKLSCWFVACYSPTRKTKCFNTHGSALDLCQFNIYPHIKFSPVLKAKDASIFSVLFLSLLSELVAKNCRLLFDD